MSRDIVKKTILIKKETKIKRIRILSYKNKINDDEIENKINYMNY